MVYVDFVNRHEARFGEVRLLKHVRDLAILLDDPMMRIDPETPNRRMDVVRGRTELFDDFCALCLRANIPTPVLERELVAAHLPSSAKSEHEVAAHNIAEFVRKQVADIDEIESDECRALTRVIKLLPSCLQEPLSIERLIAALNMRLFALGRYPIRPDYEAMQPADRANETCRRPLRVVIVDDSISELVRTARALIGWPELTVLFFHQTSDRWNLSVDEKKALLSETAKSVLSMQPDIILMDQGLAAGLEGHVLAVEITERAVETIPIVANTGGSEDQLRSIGAFSNCEKGRSLRGLRQAIQSLNA